MKDTLLKIKARLQERIDYLATKSHDEKAIYLLTDRVVPEVTDFPAIGLKDGDITYELAGGTMAGGAEFDKTLNVKVILFVRLLRVEEIVTGDGLEKGILDLAEDVKTALLGYNPDENNGTPFLIVSEGESQIYEGDILIQKKEIIFKHHKQVVI